MSFKPVQKLKLVASVGLVSMVVLSGCSNPLSGDDDMPPATDNSPTATPAPAMPIITATAVDPTAAAAAGSATPGSEVRPATYIVAENDTLYAIAARFQVDIAQLVEVNGLADPNDIYVGQELIIPPLE